MINQQSPKKLKENFFDDDFLINRILLIIESFKIHIKNQIDNGANIIQILIVGRSCGKRFTKLRIYSYSKFAIM